MAVGSRQWLFSLTRADPAAIAPGRAPRGRDKVAAYLVRLALRAACAGSVNAYDIGA